MPNRHQVALLFRILAISTHRGWKRLPIPMTSSEKAILYNVLWEDRREFAARESDFQFRRARLEHNPPGY